MSEQKPVAWMDDFGNVFPLGANKGAASWMDEHKRNWKPLFLAAPPAQPAQAQPARLSDEDFLRIIQSVGWEAAGRISMTYQDGEGNTKATHVALRIAHAIAAAIVPQVPPLVFNACAELEAEIDAGWSPAARMAVRRLRAGLNMLAAAKATKCPDPTYPTMS